MRRVFLIEELFPSDERATVASLLKERGYQVLTLADEKGSSGPELLGFLRDAIIEVLKAARRSSPEVLRRAERELSEIPVVIAGGHGTIIIDSPLELMKKGVLDFVSEPADREDLLLRIQRASQRSQPQRAVYRRLQQIEGGSGLLDMVGNSDPMLRVFEQIHMVATVHSTILITGESGTGKELVARAVQQLSPRKDGPFIVLNCVAIPKDLAESELFGHTKGAFTGATDRRVGKFAAADGGTLLIDEIGEMELSTQAKLLRTLETRTISPIGSNDEQRLDVRVLAATHRNLLSLVEAGKFREDLYYRLNVVHIDLPPLRLRQEDIPLMVETFLEQLNSEHNRNVRDVMPEAMEALKSYPWPGNVRELRNTLEGMVVMLRKPVIEVQDLPSQIQDRKPPENLPGFNPGGTTLSKLEREAIQQCLLHAGGNRLQTAKLLGISTRTLLRKIKEYGLNDPLRASAHPGRQIEGVSG